MAHLRLNLQDVAQEHRGAVDIPIGFIYSTGVVDCFAYWVEGINY